MAGHSSYKNKKYRKNRKDEIKKKNHLKVYNKLKNIIKKEGEINDKILNFARENRFSKIKVLEIKKKLEKE